jgi:hypothetical protein
MVRLCLAKTLSSPALYAQLPVDKKEIHPFRIENLLYALAPFLLCSARGRCLVLTEKSMV